MQDATHYIEQFRAINKPVGKIIQNYPPFPIQNLTESLKNTKQSPSLITVAVWKIKAK